MIRRMERVSDVSDSYSLVRTTQTFFHCDAFFCNSPSFHLLKWACKK